MRPKRIILIRHGESEGNVDDTLFETRADHTMELTERGHAQAREAGRGLKALLGDEKVQVYRSPYKRTVQTLAGLREALATNVERVVEEPRLREQDWGNFQDRDDIREQKNARNAFGHFFYRFKFGESGADVYDRVSTFLETLHRDFQKDRYPDNALLVTHGLTLRLFLTRWFHWSVEYFESLDNPSYCTPHILTRNADGAYELDRPLSQWKPVHLLRP